MDMQVTHCIASSLCHRKFLQIPPLRTSSSYLPLERQSYSDGRLNALPSQSFSAFHPRKRELTISVLSQQLNGTLQSFFCKLALSQELQLERYTNKSEGFTLLVPTNYSRVEKAGATALFLEAGNGSNTIGVVVSPIRLNKLGEFGNPEFVAEKLVDAEKRKESTKTAEVVKVAERAGNKGLQVYEFEYKLDSTRGGMKRVFSAAFVASKMLYLLNIVHSDKVDSPLDGRSRDLLEEVVHSFDCP